MKWRKPQWALASLSVLAFSAAQAAVDPLSDPRSSQGFFHFPYRLYTPDAAASGPVPLIVFLAHAGDSFRVHNPVAAEYNVAHVENYVQGLLDTAIEGSVPAYVVAPQFLERLPYNGSFHQWAHDAAKIVDFVNYMRTTLNVDPTRVYVTGLSAGGTGTWFVLGQAATADPVHPLFAAAAVLSGRDVSTHDTHTTVNNSNPVLAALNGTVLADIAPVPTWIFHGFFDEQIAISEAQDMRAQLIFFGGSPRYTEVDGGHVIWENVYNDVPTTTGRGLGGATTDGFYAWMFAQAQAPTAPPAMLPRLLPPRPGTVGQMLPGQKVLIDFGTASAEPTTGSPILHTTYTDDASQTWNALGYVATASDDDPNTYLSDIEYAFARGIAPAVHTFGLLESSGTATQTSLVIVSDFLTANAQGVVTSAGPYPEVAQSDSWAVGSFNGHAVAETNPGTVRIARLSPGALYTLKIFASRINTSTPTTDRRTLYTPAGATPQQLDAADNVDTVATFANLEATASDTIDLEVAVLPAGLGGTGGFGYLGVLDIEAVAGPTGTYSRWTFDEGLSGNDASPDADLESDNRTNLLEYALGHDPLLPDVGSEPAVEYDEPNQQLKLSYTWKRADVSYVVEVSSDLVTWTAATDQGYTEAPPLETLVTAVVDLAPNEPRKFLRLRVTLL